MNCPKCSKPLSATEIVLRTRGHGIYERCSEAFLEVNGEIIMHQRKGGLFFRKKKAPSELEAWLCPACSLIVIEK